jgi:hypothetical protein
MMRSHVGERWTQLPLTRSLGREIAEAFVDALHDPCSPSSQTIVFSLGTWRLEDWTSICGLHSIDQYLRMEIFRSCSAWEVGVEKSLYTSRVRRDVIHDCRCEINIAKGGLRYSLGAISVPCCICLLLPLGHNFRQRTSRGPANIKDDRTRNRIVLVEKLQEMGRAE